MNLKNESERLESLAPHYDSSADFDRYFLEAFADILIGRVAGSRVLDLGCSSGVTTQKFPPHVKSLDLIDGSAHYIEIAQSRVHGDNVRFFQTLFEDYHPDTKYDHIVCSHVLEHVLDPVGILEIAKQWLAPDGRIWVYVPNARSIHRMLGVAMGMSSTIYELSDRDHKIGHRRVYDADTLSQDIRKAGLEHGDLSGILIKPFPNSMMEKLDEALIKGLLQVGQSIPEHASDIYYECFL